MPLADADGVVTVDGITGNAHVAILPPPRTYIDGHICTSTSHPVQRRRERSGGKGVRNWVGCRWDSGPGRKPGRHGPRPRPCQRAPLSTHRSLTLEGGMVHPAGEQPVVAVGDGHPAHPHIGRRLEVDGIVALVSEVGTHLRPAAALGAEWGVRVG